MDKVKSLSDLKNYKGQSIANPAWYTDSPLQSEELYRYLV